MKNPKIFTVRFRRKRESKTDYKKRLSLLTSGKRRLVVRKSLKNIVAQIIEYAPTGDKVVVGVNSKELEKMGWKLKRSNMCAAYLVGLLLASKAKQKKVTEAILDTGLQQSTVKGSIIYAVLKGAVDGGLDVPHSDDILPSEERVLGKHIEEYAKKLKAENADLYGKQFSQYLKNNVKPEECSSYVQELKSKIKV